MEKSQDRPRPGSDRGTGQDGPIRGWSLVVLCLSLTLVRVDAGPASLQGQSLAARSLTGPQIRTRFCVC